MHRCVETFELGAEDLVGGERWDGYDERNDEGDERLSKGRFAAGWSSGNHLEAVAKAFQCGQSPECGRGLCDGAQGVDARSQLPVDLSRGDWQPRRGGL